MDATSLRWVLAIIGIVILAGVYLYTLYQQKLRRRAAIKTFTHEEIESGVIEDEHLSRELSSINSMLDDDLIDSDIDQIKINPALNSADAPALSPKTQTDRATAKVSVELPRAMSTIDDDKLVAYVLKHADDRVLTGSELLNAFKHAAMEINEQGLAEFSQNPVAQYIVANMTADGSLNEITDPQFFSFGIVFFFDMSETELPLSCYESMLKKVDELVRLLQLKVYDQNFQLLTLQHVNDTRDRLKVYE